MRDPIIYVVLMTYAVVAVVFQTIGLIPRYNNYYSVLGCICAFGVDIYFMGHYGFRDFYGNKPGKILTVISVVSVFLGLISTLISVAIDNFIISAIICLDIPIILFIPMASYHVKCCRKNNEELGSTL